MQQLDMFDQNHDYFFLKEIERVGSSCNEGMQLMFSMLFETQNELIRVKSLVQKMLNENNGVST